MVSLKVFLLQLPVQSHSYEYSRDNIPLALGYLQGFARNRLRRTEIQTVPLEVVSYGGDAAILRYIEQERPNVVGFGCALWNVERTLHLCRKIKSMLPETVIILGGPEVSRDNTYLFASRDFDFAIISEGEQVFTDLLLLLEESGAEFHRIPGLARQSKGGWIFNKGTYSLIEPLDAISSPYLAGLINPSFAGSMTIETVRGCPYRCAYCHYHKSYSKVRAFDLGRIEEELRWGVERGVKDVYFLDPCFARRPDLRVLLKMIQDLNREKLFRVQCELNAEDLTADLALNLSLAGVAEIEVGLQTINPKSLALIHRRFQRDKFVRGIRMLRDMGIRVLVDLMVGLPGDSLEHVKHSIDFVVANDLCDELKLYPLSVLPGTELRKRAGELGLHYQERPPYVILQTPQMGPEEIFKAFLYAEEVTGVDFFPLDMPAVSQEGKAKEHNRKGEGIQDAAIHEIILEGFDPKASKGLTSALKPWEVGQSLCLHIEDPRWQEKLEAICRFLGPIFESNPFTLVDWLIPEESYPTEKSLKIITDICLWPEHPLNREYFAAHTPIRSVRVFIISRIDGYKTPVLTKIPLFDEETLLGRLALSNAQRICWIAFPPKLGPEEEDRLIDRFKERLKPKVPGLLFTDLPEEWPPKGDDPRVRKHTIWI